jgi:hypothetical protein
MISFSHNCVMPYSPSTSLFFFKAYAEYCVLQRQGMSLIFQIFKKSFEKLQMDLKGDYNLLFFGPNSKKFKNKAQMFIKIYFSSVPE